MTISIDNPLCAVPADAIPRRERDRYAVVVIGGGHAGAEAAWAAANALRHAGDTRRVALVTLDPDKIGVMSCNPAIGGLAKGQMVREVDALGGLMARAADATGIQFKILNASKGPAVRGPRCQSDKHAYAEAVRRLLATRTNLDVIAGGVEGFLTETRDGQEHQADRCVGVRVRAPELDGPVCPTDACCGEFGAIDAYGKPVELRTAAVVLTTGTFMRGLMHTGEAQTPGGRHGEDPANPISDALKNLGFDLGRLKTGTPPRLDADSVDLAALETQPGDNPPRPFSDRTDPCAFPLLRQVDCYTTRTTPEAHALIQQNLHRAPMYNGQVGAPGPRYCPSIEDKVVRFADRTSHRVILEPESLRDRVLYCNGISTSLPAEVQAQIVRAMPGCERAVIVRPGYAVEYDMVRPHQIDATTQTKRLPGLYLAGQINGTSGYEEAAAQGLLAGLNAARRALAQDPVRIGRDLAYLGVMMDDLVTKTPVEPYRMFTSRAEHRLRLRSDNPAERLTELGRAWGLVSEARWSRFQQDQALTASIRAALRTATIDGKPGLDWARQPRASADEALRALGATNGQGGTPIATSEHEPRLRCAAEHILAELQYAGYIARQDQELARLREHEDAALPTTLDYAGLPGLRAEAAQQLAKFRPATLGQAGRIEGVNPSDVMIVHLAANRAEATAR
ncbi:MAG: tRNA uridine-5-carboxymethylaminomethyl(34) synthesis enzyme MnmG [Planctomycetota bacterium]